MSKKKVLVVDDSRVQLIYVRGLLEAAGYEIHTSTNIWVSGMVRRLKPDLVLMDVEVDGFNGVETVKNLQLIRTGQSIPIYLHSEKPAQDLEVLCDESNADGYICKAKSNTENKLVELVTSALDIVSLKAKKSELFAEVV